MASHAKVAVQEDRVVVLLCRQRTWPKSTQLRFPFTYDDQWPTKFSTPLGKESNDHSLSVGWLLQHRSPHSVATGSKLLSLELDLLLGLVELFLGDQVVRVLWRLPETLENL